MEPGSKKVSRYVLSLFLLTAGTLHFLIPEPFARIVPDYLPAHKTLVYLSGAAEVLLSIGLLIPATRFSAAMGICALLIAVFPANVNMATHHIRFAGLPDGPILYWLRLPLQLVLILWAWWER